MFTLWGSHELQSPMPLHLKKVGGDENGDDVLQGLLGFRGLGFRGLGFRI